LYHKNGRSPLRDLARLFLKGTKREVPARVGHAWQGRDEERLRRELGGRGSYRAKPQHGVGKVKSGNRCLLGVIFHDAR